MYRCSSGKFYPRCGFVMPGRKYIVRDGHCFSDSGIDPLPFDSCFIIGAKSLTLDARTLHMVFVISRCMDGLCVGAVKPQ